MTLDEVPDSARICTRFFNRDEQCFFLVVNISGKPVHVRLMPGWRESDKLVQALKDRRKAKRTEERRRLMSALRARKLQKRMEAPKVVDEPVPPVDHDVMVAGAEAPDPFCENEPAPVAPAAPAKLGRPVGLPNIDDRLLTMKERREKRKAKREARIRQEGLDALAERTKDVPPNEDRDVEWAYRHMGAKNVDMETAPSTAAWLWLEMAHATPEKFLEHATKRADAKAKLHGSVDARKIRYDHETQMRLIDRVEQSMGEDLQSLLSELLTRRPTQTIETLAKLGWALERVPRESASLQPA